MLTSPTVPNHTARELVPMTRRAPNWSLGGSSRLGDRFLPTGRPTGPRGAIVVPARAPRPSTEPDDLELLERVLRHDHEAFEAFYARFKNLILACASRVCARAGVRLQADDLADLVSEVTLNMVSNDYRRLRLYRTDGGCSVSSWVGVIASSTAHDFLRKERRRRLDPTLDAELERIATPVDGPDQELIDRQQRRFVDEALAKFSARDRHFVQLYFVEAMAPEAIAEKMNVSVSTVYSKKAKIKTRLRALATAAA